MFAVGKILRIPVLGLGMNVIIGLLRMIGNAWIQNQIANGWGFSISPGKAIVLLQYFLMIPALAMIVLCIARLLKGMSRAQIQISTFIVVGYALVSSLLLYFWNTSNMLAPVLIQFPVGVYHAAGFLFTILLEEIHPVLSVLPPTVLPLLFLLGKGGDRQLVQR